MDEHIILRALADAIESNKIDVHYQPKLDCLTNKIRGIEVLARWNHPGIGKISPSHFIPLAETDGLITPLTLAVMKKGLNQFQILVKSLGPTPGRDRSDELVISFNLSGVTLGDLNAVDLVIECIEKSGVLPDQIMLELTETAYLPDTKAVLINVEKLQLAGIRLSMDDFGTGYSSSVELDRLAFSELKIDRYFVQRCSTSERSKTIIRHITAMAHALNMTVTAEGVESESAMQHIKDMGCDLAQGNWISPPIPYDRLLKWLQTRQQELTTDW